MSTIRPSRHAGAAQPGFTLLELLLALVITGVVAGVLYASLAVAFDAREAAREEVGAGAVGRTALEVVRGDLAGVLEPSGILAGAMLGTDGTGPEGYPADELAYTTNNRMMPTGDEPGELKSVELRLVAPPDPRPGEEPARGYHMVRDIQTNLLARNEPRRSRQVLAERVMGMDIRYYDGSAWLDAWDSAQQGDTRPTVVAIILQLLPAETDEDAARLEEELIPVRRHILLPMAPSESQRQARGGL